MRSCTVRGGDIYAITAPLVAEAAEFAIGSTDGGIRVAAELGVLTGTWTNQPGSHALVRVDRK